MNWISGLNSYAQQQQQQQQQQQFYDQRVKSFEIYVYQFDSVHVVDLQRERAGQYWLPVGLGWFFNLKK